MHKYHIHLGEPTWGSIFLFYIISSQPSDWHSPPGLADVFLSELLSLDCCPCFVLLNHFDILSLCGCSKSVTLIVIWDTFLIRNNSRDFICIIEEVGLREKIRQLYPFLNVLQSGHQFFTECQKHLKRLTEQLKTSHKQGSPNCNALLFCNYTDRLFNNSMIHYWK